MIEQNRARIKRENRPTQLKKRWRIWPSYFHDDSCRQRLVFTAIKGISIIKTYYGEVGRATCKRSQLHVHQHAFTNCQTMKGRTTNKSCRNTDVSFREHTSFCSSSLGPGLKDSNTEITSSWGCDEETIAMMP